jgi:ribonuclease-3
MEEFDLSDISATPQEKTREQIIAEAEAAAFENQ